MSVKFVDVRSLNYGLWKEVVRLYSEDPLTHVYLVYDLVYELDNSDFYFAVSDGEVQGYLLIWRGLRTLGVHVWGKARGLLKYLPKDFESVINVYNEELLGPTLDVLGNTTTVRKYLDMVVDERSFRPYRGVEAVRLDPTSEDHVRRFVEIKRIQGRPIDEGRAKEVLRKWRYYGVFEGEVLASMACAYVRTRDVWIIGDVFTRPDYRGRGFAKTATSAVTNDAVSSGARALLHVDYDNTPAIRAYKALGYEARSSKYWVFYKPTR